MREFTWLALFLGVAIGAVFGAANAFIGLKVGMTVSASIPAAVISMAILRGIMKRKSILENNMVQTIGSVGESLAAGMIFVIPALFIFANDPDNPAASMAPKFWEIVIWGALGGLLGVLFMIPLRRLLIVKEHGKLPFPEGTACAEVLESGERGGASAKTVFAGLGIGALVEFVRGLGFFPNVAAQRLPLLKTSVGLDSSPALLGVGYILGIRVAGYMLAGACLGWFVLIPAIAFFGQDVGHAIFPASDAIADMDPGAIWSKYVRYIGAGAVVLGGLLSLFRSLGTIGKSFFSMFAGRGSSDRTDRDIPAIVLLLLLGGLGAAMWYLPKVGLLNALFNNVIVIACVIGFGFFFVTVSSRLVGIVGSSSNPASGMTIATILGTALIIVAVAPDLGLDPTQQKVAIISVGALVCIALCIAGDTSQDLKTGFLVKATPWKQQVGEIIGVLAATVALAGVIWLIKDQYGFVKTDDTPNPVPAYQANLMKLVVQGVVDQALPWNLILIGMACAFVVELLGIPALPFAVGLYLPLELSSPIMVGGLLRWLVDRRRSGQSEAHNPGVLASSGLVAGHGLMGVGLVGVAAFIGWIGADPYFAAPKYHTENQQWVQFDQSKDAWAYVDEESQSPVFYDEANSRWADGNPPPPPATLPATLPGDEEAKKPRPKGQRVVPSHTFAWLTTKFDFLEMEYGLRSLKHDKADEERAFSGDYAVDWFSLLPLAPFALMTVWLAFVALRRTPAGDEPRPASVGTGPAAPPPPDLSSIPLSGGMGDSGSGSLRTLDESPGDKLRLEDELSSSIQPLGGAGDTDSGLPSLHEEPPPPIGDPPAPPDDDEKPD